MIEIREFGCQLSYFAGNPNELLNYGVLADRCGFNHVRIGDHSLWPPETLEVPDSWTLLTAIAIKTEKVKVGNLVTDAIRRHPLELAQSALTLDNLARGRVSIGIGAGEVMNLLPFGFSFDRPVRRLKEAITVMKKLFLATPKNPAHFEGDFFKLRGAYLQLKAYSKPHPPIYVGALGQRTREMAGELADGWIPMNAESPGTFKSKLDDVLRGARKAGRTKDELDFVAPGYLAISDDREEAFKALERGVRMALVLERSNLRSLGLEPKIPEDITIQRVLLEEPNVSLLSKAASEIPRRIVEDACFFGSVEDIIGKVENYLQAGATSVSVAPVGSAIRKVYEVFGKKVIPYFRGR